MKFDNLLIMVLFLAVIMAGGLLGGAVYTEFKVLQTSLQDIDFVIPGARNSTEGVANVTTFQEVLDITIYPLFYLTDSLPYLVYFMCFAFIIGLAIVAYLSSKNPIFFILHLLFTLVLTYLAIILSNTYAELLTNPFINNMMIDFSVYNKIMLFLPQIFFITSIVFAGIAFVNVIKPSTKDSPYGINYGGDY